MDICSFSVSTHEFQAASYINLFWWGLSGVTTALSWVYYYRALKLGDVSTIALIDKGSAVVAILLAWLILKEVITVRMIIGAACIVLGLFIISKNRELLIAPYLIVNDDQDRLVLSLKFLLVLFQHFPNP
ncbi:EamA family transporter [Acinetobacter sp. SWAC57]|uniref:EamA family transporter n=1 Tax=Acinetobacter sp. SWAC57 TaxID=2293834 RepID=UPI00267EE78A